MNLDPSAMINNLLKLTAPELAVAEATDAAVAAQAESWAKLSQMERDHTTAQLLFGQLVVLAGIVRALGDLEKRLETIQANQGAGAELVGEKLDAIRAVLERPVVMVPPPPVGGA